MTSSNSVITTLCSGKVIAINTDSEADAIKQFVVMLRSGVLGTDVRPVIDTGRLSNQDMIDPLHVSRISFMHGQFHTATRPRDFVGCDH